MDIETVINGFLQVLIFFMLLWAAVSLLAGVVWVCCHLRLLDRVLELLERLADRDSGEGLWR